MSTTVTGKLNRDANQFPAGESTGFGVRIGVQYYDRETRQKEWTNYEAVVFSKNPAQIQFYQGALVEDSVVEITGDQIKIKEYNGKLSLELLNAKIGFLYTGQQAPRPQPTPQQPSSDNYNAQGDNMGNAAAQPVSYAQPQPGSAQCQTAPVSQTVESHSNPPQGDHRPHAQPQASMQRPASSAPQAAPEMDSFDDDIPF